jgi:hypothetical protein
VSDIDDDTEPKPKRRGCFGGCLKALLIIIGLLAVLVWGGRSAMRRAGERQLQSVVRQLDAEQPGWKLDELEAVRVGKFPPPEESAATLIPEIAAKSPKAFDEWQVEDGKFPREGNGVSNHRHSDKRLALVRGVADATRDARALAHTLRDRAPGGFPINHTTNPWATLLPHAQEARKVAALLQYDALLASANGDYDGAIRSARTGLHAAKTLADEPFLISQLVRIALSNVAASSAFQAMAWGEPKAGLPQLQAALMAEGDAPILVTGLLGERATMHKFFTNIENGTLTVEELLKSFDGNAPQFWKAGGMRLYKAMVPGDHAECLRVFNLYIEAAKRPPHEQLAAFKAIPLPPRPPDDFRYLLTSLFLPAVDRMAEATLRSRAHMHAAAVAIAVERFRQKHGRWPTSLEEIPKDILPSIPADPYTGEPMRFLPMPDGVAVYAVGPPNDERRRLQPRHGPVNGDGVGWRLYDPDKRGLPPKPEPVEEEGEKGGRGEGEKGRGGEGEKKTGRVARGFSPCLRVSVSPCLRVSPSPPLCRL